jgi:hypothetical protein
MTWPCTTVFRFICVHCGQENEIRETHGAHLRPQLISVTCTRCQSFNWLGGLEGTLEDAAIQTAAGPTPSPRS